MYIDQKKRKLCHSEERLTKNSRKHSYPSFFDNCKHLEGKDEQIFEQELLFDLSTHTVMDDVHVQCRSDLWSRSMFDFSNAC